MKAFVTAAVLIGFAAPAFAANANQPFQNVDHSNDAGNGTGDAKVDSLNRGQLDQNQGAANSGQAQPAVPGTPAPQR